MQPPSPRQVGCLVERLPFEAVELFHRPARDRVAETLRDVARREGAEPQTLLGHENQLPGREALPVGGQVSGPRIHDEVALPQLLRSVAKLVEVEGRIFHPYEYGLTEDQRREEEQRALIIPE